ncbi:alpha-1,2-fucosyltransferase [Sporomusaceae bacterium FL31]|nr:alpha-1,2-fucosyltransferase [Sporomusaceae bacterium FL31]GCE33897.1 alpha-1,2-fucosyltransferase [Sporomusaceae bacterium]
MIIVKLIGGLGNQLFQYSMARRISFISGEEIKLDLSEFKEYKLRVYELHNFNIIENIATPDEIEKLAGCNSIYTKFFKKITSILPFNKKTYVKEKSFCFDSEILSINKNAYLEGYWQSEKYFKDIEEIIRSEITIKSPLSGKNLQLAEKIENTNAIAIHIRRGDYASNPLTNEYHGLCHINYYHEAISLLLKKIRDPQFFVFSDDCEWSQQNLNLPYPTTFVNHNGSDYAYEDIRLMSLCKHNVIANSSFSWWGAWLNRNPQKMVIAPKQWFKKHEIDTSDLIPDKWIRI